MWNSALSRALETLVSDNNTIVTGIGLGSPFTCARITHQTPALCPHTILASSPVRRRFPSSVGGFHDVLLREDRTVEGILQVHRRSKL
jgi:hypothetical protein